MPVPTVFISYSHRDEAWKNKLLPQLHALEQAGIGMQVCHDRKIDGGDQWYPEIQEAMANAAVGVLLISPDFLASGFITKEEVPYLIEGQEKHGLCGCLQRARSICSDTERSVRGATRSTEFWQKYDAKKAAAPK